MFWKKDYFIKIQVPIDLCNQLNWTPGTTKVSLIRYLPLESLTFVKDANLGNKLLKGDKTNNILWLTKKDCPRWLWFKARINRQYVLSVEIIEENKLLVIIC